MGDTTRQIDSAPPEIQDMRRVFSQYLQWPGSGNVGQYSQSSQPANQFIGAQNYANPNTGAPALNPITGQQPGTGPMSPPPTPNPPSYGPPATDRPSTTPQAPAQPAPALPPTALPPTQFGGPATVKPPDPYKPPTAPAASTPFAPAQFDQLGMQPKTKDPAPTFFNSLVAPQQATAQTTQTAQAPANTAASPYYSIRDDASQALTLTVPGSQFVPGYDPNTMHPQALETLTGMFQTRGFTLVPVPKRGFVAVPTESYNQNPMQTGGLTPGNVAMNQVSPTVVGEYNGPIHSTPVTEFPEGYDPMGGTTWQPGQPMDFPTTPPALPGAGGPVAGGGPTGTGLNPPGSSGPSTFPSIPNQQPGNSAFDRMIAQLPPDMARIIMTDPAFIDALQQARTQYDAPQSQSIDQLGGANSAFFQNMMSQLQPAFAQSRAENLAAAKEASGNLTGSGYANSLGAASNRSLGAEQAMLADYASRGVQSEMARQLQQAGIDLSALQMGQQGEFFNIGNEFQRRGTNADAVNRFALTQAGLDADRNKTQYGANVSTNQLNAQQYLQSILGMINGPRNDTITQGGAGSFLGPLISALPYLIPLL